MAKKTITRQDICKVNNIKPSYNFSRINNSDSSKYEL